MDKRVWFFLGAAALCLVMVPATPEKLRYVAWAISATYVALAVLFALDSWAAHRERVKRRRHRSSPGQTP